MLSNVALGGTVVLEVRPRNYTIIVLCKAAVRWILGEALRGDKWPFRCSEQTDSLNIPTGGSGRVARVGRPAGFGVEPTAE